MSERIIELTWSPCSLNMRCKYKSFGCYYESIHSSPPSGSLAIRGGKIVYCEKVDFLVSEVILFYRLFFFFSFTYLQCLTPSSEFFSTLFLSSCPVCAFFFFKLYSFHRSIPSFLTLSSSHTPALFFFFSHTCPHPPIRQSCARCHVAATVSARRASASARKVGLALRATRERAILAAKNTASATMGPASVSLAGRESTVTLVSCVCVHVGVFNYSL